MSYGHAPSSLHSSDACCIAVESPRPQLRGRLGAIHEVASRCNGLAKEIEGILYGHKPCSEGNMPKLESVEDMMEEVHSIVKELNDTLIQIINRM